MSPLYQSKVVWTNENRVMGQRSCRNFYFVILKMDWWEFFATKMGGDFSKLGVALILALIRIYQCETCRDLSKWGDLHSVE